jgi:hypothetical protein
VRKTLGTLAVAVLLTFAIYMAVFGRGWGPRQPATTVAAVPSPSQSSLVAAALPGVTATAIRRAWERRWDVPAKDTGPQTVLRTGYPGDGSELLLTLTRVPEDQEAVWGVSCVRDGKPAPYSKAELTDLLDFCLPPEVAGAHRREIVDWLTPFDDNTWRVHRQFAGFTAVVKHFQPRDAVPADDQEPTLQLSLTGGTYFPA